MLSTDAVEFGAAVVDISGITASRGRQTAEAGPAARWCSTKWGLLARTGAASAAAKSALFRMRHGWRVAGALSAAPACVPRAIGPGAAGKRAGAGGVRQPGACGLWRGARRSPHVRHGSSCARESRGCGRVGSSRLGRCVSWLGLGGRCAEIRVTRDYSKKVVCGQRLASQRLAARRTVAQADAVDNHPWLGQTGLQSGRSRRTCPQ